MIKHKKVFTLLSLALMAAMLFTVFAPVAAAPKEKVRVWVEFAPGKKGNVEAALRGNGAQFHYTFDDLNSFVVTLPSAALSGISNNPNVVDIEEDVKRYPMAVDAVEAGAALADEIIAGQQVVPWGVTAVQAPEAWATSTGAGIKLCIIDSGYYEGHEDLPDGMSGVSQVDNAWDEDGLGHGSHVAGTIAAENDSDGVVGVAYDVELFIVKIFDNSGAWTTSSDLAAAANTCVANGADIISMSLGGGYSRKEERAFNTIYANGVLPIAAASNDGTSAYSYPASYSSVVSVAAIDESLSWADFSNFNDAVEVAAPGVDVLSTVPYIESRSLVVDGVSYNPQHVEFAAYGSASGQLVDGGLCTSTGAWSGKVVLCERGEISFYDKVMNVQNSGGAAAVIYNNVPDEELYATLGEGFSSSIVALGITQEDGQYLVNNKLGTTALVSASYLWPANGYENYQGTSMATPHASAVAALVWSACPSASAAEVREALGATAFDLGAAGRDVYYGFGLVQAADAIDYLCGGAPVNNPPSVSINSPANGASFTEGDLVSFSGSATDAEDGNLSGAISWVSSIDGALGSGASVSAVLSVGTHMITASVSDSEGASDSDSITVTVNPVGGGGDLVVAVSTDKASYGDREKVYVTTLVTADGAAVSGAAVSSTITFPNNTTATYSGVTGSDGTFTFNYRLNVRKTGSGTATVDSTASAAGFSDGSGSTTFIIQ
ncbi:MAG: S8 family serine peptidase [Anaerolineae bacterium]|jgi:subtilisin family serine protease|nr:S8 family serine peptidase [Anaerolineae bacterium]